MPMPGGNGYVTRWRRLSRAVRNTWTWSTITTTLPLWKNTMVRNTLWCGRDQPRLSRDSGVLSVQTMHDESVIVRGLDTPDAKENLYSTVHGAGRVMSRTKAAGKFKGWGRKRVQVAPGLIDENQMRQSVAEKGVFLFGGGADEAPGCYKKLDEVLGFHQDSK